MAGHLLLHCSTNTLFTFYQVDIQDIQHSEFLFEECKYLDVISDDNWNTSHHDTLLKPNTPACTCQRQAED